MTEIGIFARVFPPGEPAQVARSIGRAGFTVTQLNLSVLGRPTLDAGLTDREARDIAASFVDTGVRIWGLSGTFNAVHPEPAVRRRAIDACLVNIRRAAAMGAEVVTLCSGTRDAQDMWHDHPANRTEEAWSDLRGTLDDLLPVASEAGVRLGIEPDAGNVISDAATAARLLAELGPEARHVAIVLDPANLLSVETLPQQPQILGRAYALLGERVAAVHAKDVVARGYAAPGVGGMDYGLVARLHAELPRPVPIIAQDVDPADAPRVATFLAEHMDGSTARA